VQIPAAHNLNGERIMTGAFLRVKRDNKWLNIEVEHLTDDEREEILKNDTRLLQWLNCVCKKLVELENLFDSLVEEGILRKGDKNEQMA